MKENTESSISKSSNGHTISSDNFIRVIITDGAQAWNISQRSLILIWLIPVIIILFAVISAVISKDMYKWYTGEDNFAETMQVVFYFIALLINLELLKKFCKHKLKFVSSLYLIVLLGLIFKIGEELSWGQRILGWQTNETFSEINKQAETNLHNIYGVGATFKWLQLLIGAYGTFFPLIVIAMKQNTKFKTFLSFIIPHFTLIPFFLPLFIWRIYRNLFEAPHKYYFAIAEFNEVMELILAIGLSLFMFYQLKSLMIGRKVEAFHDK